MAIRTLLTDDHTLFRQGIKTLLSTAPGLEVVGEAANAADAVAQCADLRPDVVLMDVNMPGLSSFEATRQIRAIPELAGVPIIAVTSYALSGDEAKTREAGCDGYVAKPFSPRQLLAKIREFLPDEA